MLVCGCLSCVFFIFQASKSGEMGLTHWPNWLNHPDYYLSKLVGDYDGRKVMPVVPRSLDERILLNREDTSNSISNSMSLKPFYAEHRRQYDRNVNFWKMKDTYTPEKIAGVLNNAGIRVSKSKSPGEYRMDAYKLAQSQIDGANLPLDTARASVTAWQARGTKFDHPTYEQMRSLSGELSRSGFNQRLNGTDFYVSIPSASHSEGKAIHLPNERKATPAVKVATERSTKATERLAMRNTMASVLNTSTRSYTLLKGNQQKIGPTTGVLSWGGSFNPNVFNPWAEGCIGEVNGKMPVFKNAKNQDNIGAPQKAENAKEAPKMSTYVDDSSAMHAQPVAMAAAYAATGTAPPVPIPTVPVSKAKVTPGIPTPATGTNPVKTAMLNRKLANLHRTLGPAPAVPAAPAAAAPAGAPAPAPAPAPALPVPPAAPPMPGTVTHDPVARAKLTAIEAHNAAMLNEMKALTASVQKGNNDRMTMHASTQSLLNTNALRQEALLKDTLAQTVHGFTQLTAELKSGKHAGKGKVDMTGVTSKLDEVKGVIASLGGTLKAIEGQQSTHAGLLNTIANEQYATRDVLQNKLDTNATMLRAGMDDIVTAVGDVADAQKKFKIDSTAFDPLRKEVAALKTAVQQQTTQQNMQSTAMASKQDALAAQLAKQHAENEKKSQSRHNEQMNKQDQTTTTIVSNLGALGKTLARPPPTDPNMQRYADTFTSAVGKLETALAEFKASAPTSLAVDLNPLKEILAQMAASEANRGATYIQNNHLHVQMQEKFMRELQGMQDNFGKALQTLEAKSEEQNRTLTEALKALPTTERLALEWKGKDSSQELLAIKGIMEDTKTIIGDLKEKIAAKSPIDPGLQKVADLLEETNLKNDENTMKLIQELQKQQEFNAQKVGAETTLGPTDRKPDTDMGAQPPPTVDPLRSEEKLVEKVASVLADKLSEREQRIFDSMKEAVIQGLQESSMTESEALRATAQGFMDLLREDRASSREVLEEIVAELRRPQDISAALSERAEEQLMDVLSTVKETQIQSAREHQKTLAERMVFEEEQRQEISNLRQQTQTLLDERNYIDELIRAQREANAALVEKVEAGFRQGTTVSVGDETLTELIRQKIDLEQREIGLRNKYQEMESAMMDSFEEMRREQEARVRDFVEQTKIIANEAKAEMQDTGDTFEEVKANVANLGLKHAPKVNELIERAFGNLKPLQEKTAVLADNLDVLTRLQKRADQDLTGFKLEKFPHGIESSLLKPNDYDEAEKVKVEIGALESTALKDFQEMNDAFTSMKQEIMVEAMRSKDPTTILEEFEKDVGTPFAQYAKQFQDTIAMLKGEYSTASVALESLKASSSYYNQALQKQYDNARQVRDFDQERKTAAETRVEDLAKADARLKELEAEKQKQLDAQKLLTEEAVRTARLLGQRALRREQVRANERLQAQSSVDDTDIDAVTLPRQLSISHAPEVARPNLAVEHLITPKADNPLIKLNYVASELLKNVALRGDAEPEDWMKVMMEETPTIKVEDQIPEDVKQEHGVLTDYALAKEAAEQGLITKSDSPDEVLARLTPTESDTAGHLAHVDASHWRDYLREQISEIQNELRANPTMGTLKLKLPKYAELTLEEIDNVVNDPNSTDHELFVAAAAEGVMGSYIDVEHELQRLYKDVSTKKGQEAEALYKELVILGRQRVLLRQELSTIAAKLVKQPELQAKLEEQAKESNTFNDKAYDVFRDLSTARTKELIKHVRVSGNDNADKILEQLTKRVDLSQAGRAALDEATVSNFDKQYGEHLKLEPKDFQRSEPASALKASIARIAASTAGNTLAPLEVDAMQSKQKASLDRLGAALTSTVAPFSSSPTTQEGYLTLANDGLADIAKKGGPISQQLTQMSELGRKILVTAQRSGNIEAALPALNQLSTMYEMEVEDLTHEYSLPAVAAASSASSTASAALEGLKRQEDHRYRLKNVSVAESLKASAEKTYKAALQAKQQDFIDEELSEQYDRYKRVMDNISHSDKLKLLKAANHLTDEGKRKLLDNVVRPHTNTEKQRVDSQLRKTQQGINADIKSARQVARGPLQTRQSLGALQEWLTAKAAMGAMDSQPPTRGRAFGPKSVLTATRATAHLKGGKYVV